MKKKNLMNVLAVVVTCAMLAGCSQQADTTAPAKAEEETIDTADTEEVAEEPEEVKEASYLLSITAANEDGTYSACDAEKTDYTLTLDETFPEEQKELLVPEAGRYRNRSGGLPWQIPRTVRALRLPRCRPRKRTPRIPWR